MKTIGITSAAILALLLAIAAPAFAQEQHEQEQKEKPDRQEERKAQPAKSTKQDQKATAQQERDTKSEQKNAQQQEKNAQRQEKNTRQSEEKNAKPEANSAAQHHSGEQLRQAHGRIPDDRFRAHFGQQHTFRVSRDDYSRDRHFQYGGYSFGFVDEWPSSWLYTQDVYVIEIDGVYYLCNPAYPGVNVTLSIVL